MLAVEQMRQPLSVMSVVVCSVSGVKKNCTDRKDYEIMNGPVLKLAMSHIATPARAPVEISCRAMPQVAGREQ